MDIVMPDMDGVAAMQIIRATPTTRIIALTMYRQERYMLNAVLRRAPVDTCSRL